MYNSQYQGVEVERLLFTLILFRTHANNAMVHFRRAEAILIK